MKRASYNRPFFRSHSMNNYFTYKSTDILNRSVIYHLYEHKPICTHTGSTQVVGFVSSTWTIEAAFIFKSFFDWTTNYFCRYCREEKNNPKIYTIVATGCSVYWVWMIDL